MDSPGDAYYKRRMKRFHVLILALFALFAVLYNLLVWDGNSPYIFLTSDAANNASFAAAMDHPEFFHNDAMLGDPANYQYYRILLLPLIRWLAPLVGDYGTAHNVLIAPFMFLHLAGFYLFGLVLLRDKRWAAVLSVLSLAPISVGFTFWGAYRAPLSRVLFQSFLPFVLAGAVQWRNRPKLWPLVLFAAGLLMNVHSISTPAVGFGLWCGFLLFLPGEWSLARKLVHMLLCGLAFLLAVAPFTLNYFGHSAPPVPPGQYAELYTAMMARFEPAYVDIRYALVDFFKPAMLVLLVAAGISIRYLLKVRPQDKKLVWVFVAWAAGILFVSLGLTGAEQVLARLHSTLPHKGQMVRGVRFLIPFSLILAAWALRELSLKQQSARAAKWIFILLVLATMGAWTENMVKRTRDLRQGYFFTMKSEEKDFVAMLDAIREDTPQGARFLALPSKDMLPVRYYALRPLVHAWKDGGIVGFASNEAMLKWWEQDKEIRRIEALESPGERMAQWIAFARSLDAEYLLMKTKMPESAIQDEHATEMIRNPSYVLFQLAGS